MSAPSISLTRGNVTLTMAGVPKNGFEIRGSISQLSLDADWTIALSLFKADPASIAPDDTAATFTVSAKVPFNESPSEAQVIARMQGIVDFIFDTQIPTP